MLERMIRLVKDEEGATALEYGLLAALIAAVIIGAVTSLGTTVSNTFGFINTKLKDAAPTP